tara:strand:+ start:2040 stop:2369 length:330 start_codon:yes stop_codon:yes gene_type:complete
MIDTNKYKLVNGTSYDKRTDDEVIRILEHCRMNNIRVVLDYGDTKTGKSWNERYGITGKVGRSSGQIKVPILLYNKRSHGGGAMLTHCIIGIKRSKGKDTLYRWKEMIE